jgi:hypothetical protein
MEAVQKAMQEHVHPYIGKDSTFSTRIRDAWEEIYRKVAASPSSATDQRELFLQQYSHPFGDGIVSQHLTQGIDDVISAATSTAPAQRSNVVSTNQTALTLPHSVDIPINELASYLGTSTKYVQKMLVDERIDPKAILDIGAAAKEVGRQVSWVKNTLYLRGVASEDLVTVARTLDELTVELDQNRQVRPPVGVVLELYNACQDPDDFEHLMSYATEWVHTKSFADDWCNNNRYSGRISAARLARRVYGFFRKIKEAFDGGGQQDVHLTIELVDAELESDPFGLYKLERGMQTGYDGNPIELRDRDFSIPPLPDSLAGDTSDDTR